MVAIPCRNEIRSVVFADLISCLLHGAVYWSKRHPGGAFHVHTYARAHVVEARNSAYETALETGADWVLWLDDDMAPPADLLERLHGAGKKFVGALAHRRAPPYEPCVARLLDGKVQFFDPDPTAEIIEADLTGFACILTHVSVLRAAADAVDGPPFSMRPGLAEDFFFCQAARKAGVQLHILPGCDVGHAGDLVVRSQHRRAALNELAGRGPVELAAE